MNHGAHGALANDWRWEYKWNSEGRLVGMVTRTQAVTAGMPNLRLGYSYDDQGRRIYKKVEYLGSGAGRTVETRFVYDNWNLIGEFTTDSQNGSSSRFYTWGLDVNESMQGTGGVGALLAVHQDGKSYVPVYDGNGNIIALCDSSSGAEIAHWRRGPFGELISASGDTEACPFGFASRYTDAETGLVYFGYRYYSPQTGRWLSREPLGEWESFNLYAYCGNDPVNKVDVLGLSAFDYVPDWADKAIKAFADEGHASVMGLGMIMDKNNGSVVRAYSDTIHMGAGDLKKEIKAGAEDAFNGDSEFLKLSYTYVYTMTEVGEGLLTGLPDNHSTSADRAAATEKMNEIAGSNHSSSLVYLGQFTKALPWAEGVLDIGVYHTDQNGLPAFRKFNSIKEQALYTGVNGVELWMTTNVAMQTTATASRQVNRVFTNLIPNQTPLLSRGVGNRAPLRDLTIHEKINIRSQWKELGGDNRMLRFDGSKPTAYSDPTIGGNNTVNVSGNVFPRASGTHNRSLMSTRAVLAHELGHVNYAGTKLNTLSVRDWRPEFGASNWGARHAPNLSPAERASLLQDALDRASEAGHVIPDAARSRMMQEIWGY